MFAVSLKCPTVKMRIVFIFTRAFVACERRVSAIDRSRCAVGRSLVLRVGIVGGWSWPPQFMSTDTHFWMKIGFKFQSLGKISNISAADSPVFLGQFQHCLFYAIARWWRERPIAQICQSLVTHYWNNVSTHRPTLSGTAVIWISMFYIECPRDQDEITERMNMSEI